jgi:hypothetical protein
LDLIFTVSLTFLNSKRRGASNFVIFEDLRSYLGAKPIGNCCQVFIVWISTDMFAFGPTCMCRTTKRKTSAPNGRNHKTNGSRNSTVAGGTSIWSNTWS